MTTETETLVRFLDGANLVAEGAPRPETTDDAADVLASVHQLMATTEALHDQVAGCFGPVDDNGRCTDCGRLVVPGMWRAHKDGPGCLMAIPFVGTAMWLVNHREGIPVVGNLLWRYRRHTSSTVGVALRPSAPTVEPSARPVSPDPSADGSGQ